MTAASTPTDPLDILPDPTEVRRRLGATYRIARILRGLLRLTEQRRDHNRLVSPPQTEREVSRHE